MIAAISGVREEFVRVSIVANKVAATRGSGQRPRLPAQPAAWTISPGLRTRLMFFRVACFNHSPQFSTRTALLLCGYRSFAGTYWHASSMSVRVGPGLV